MNITIDFDSCTKYLTCLDQSIEDMNSFWLSRCESLKWMSPPQNGYNEQKLSNPWFEQGMLNACQNCIDLHLPQFGSNIAIIEDDGNRPPLRVSYAQLHRDVSLFANMLIEAGASQNKSVTIYMASTSKLIISMLACARLGVTHHVVYRKFSLSSLAVRLNLSKSSLLITDEQNGDKSFKPLSERLSYCEERCPHLRTVIWYSQRPYHRLRSCEHYVFEQRRGDLATSSTPIPCRSDDTLFTYTTHDHKTQLVTLNYPIAGFLLQNLWAFKSLFSQESDSLFWCSMDISRCESHALGVYGALSSGATLYLPTGQLRDRPSKLLKRLRKFHVTDAFMSTHDAELLFNSQLKETKKGVEAHWGSLRSMVIAGDYLSSMTHSVISSPQVCPYASIKQALFRPQIGTIALCDWTKRENTPLGSFGYPALGMSIDIEDGKNIFMQGNRKGCMRITCSWPCAPIQGDEHSNENPQINKKESTERIASSKVFMIPFIIDKSGAFWFDNTPLAHTLAYQVIPVALADKVEQQFEFITGVVQASIFVVTPQSADRLYPNILVAFIELGQEYFSLTTEQREEMEKIIHFCFDEELEFHPIVIEHDKFQKDECLAFKDMMRVEPEYLENNFPLPAASLITSSSVQ